MVLKIYLCAFLKEEYLEEAKICIQSIRTIGEFRGPIYLFTDMLENIEGVNVIKVSCESVPLSASYRTRLFEHITDFSNDDIVLYLDTDIIVMKKLPDFTNINNKIHVYGYPTRNQSELSFAGGIEQDINYKKIPGICSGILLFRPSQKVKQVFEEAYELYLELLSQNKVYEMWEQPALCLKLIENDMCEISLNNLVCEERDNPSRNNPAIFNHLCGMRSNERKDITKEILNQKIIENKKKNSYSMVHKEPLIAAEYCPLKTPFIKKLGLNKIIFSNK